MQLINRLDMTVTAPTKTTTKIVLEALGVKVDRSAGSVKRAVEEALNEFAHLLREPLLKEARAARAQEEPLGPRMELDKPAAPEQEEGEAIPLPPNSIFCEVSGILATVPSEEPAGNVAVEPFAPATSEQSPLMAFPGDGRDGFTGVVEG